MNERAPAPTPEPGPPLAEDAHLDALARPVAADGLSLALYADEPADAVGVAHALALRLRDVHGLEVEFFVPADGDGLVARLAQIVAGVPPAVLHGQGPSPAPDRVLVAADASTIPIQAEQALAALVRDCPGANLRVLLPVAGRPERRDRRSAFGPRLVRVAVDAEPPADDRTAGLSIEAMTAVAQPAAAGASEAVGGPSDGPSGVRSDGESGGASGATAGGSAGLPSDGATGASSGARSGAPSGAPSDGSSDRPSDGPSDGPGADATAGTAMGQRESDASRPVATWLNAPVPARPARRVWMIGVGLLAVVLAVALGAAWFDPPAEHSTPPAAGEAGEAGEAGGGPQVAARPDGVKDAASGQPAAEGERSDRAASGAAGAAEGASDVAAPKEATSREAASEPAASEAKASEAKASEAKAPDAVSRAVAAPSRRPDPALVRRTGDRAWFVQHAAVASADEARDWLAARPALDRAGAVPILSADGRAMVAIVTGPFPDRDSADRWAEAATPPDERWLRGARSLKAALRAP